MRIISILVLTLSVCWLVGCGSAAKNLSADANTVTTGPEPAVTIGKEQAIAAALKEAQTSQPELEAPSAPTAAGAELLTLANAYIELSQRGAEIDSVGDQTPVWLVTTRGTWTNSGIVLTPYPAYQSMVAIVDAKTGAVLRTIYLGGT